MIKKIEGGRKKMRKIIKENKIYILTMIVIILIFNLKLPYYINAPGGTIDISNRIQYEEKKDYEGSLNLLYVTEYVATIPTYLLSYVMKDWDLESIKSSQISDETTEEINIRNKVMLDNSINNAIYVAYQEAGCKIEVKDKKNIVIGTTLENGLAIGDEVLEINGEVIENVNQVKKIIEQSKVGEKLLVKIKRNDKESEVEVEVKEISDSKVLGIVLITNYEYEIDPTIELTFKASESGSSGGLMMALSIYSAISGKDILKGRNIAGTGTIDINGNVGEIAGIKYKIMGAVKNHMDIVLVPSDNYEEAKQVVKNKKYDIELVEIKTFQDAIEYLEKETS